VNGDKFDIGTEGRASMLLSVKFLSLATSL
jgi:hypothetical protein